MEITIGTRFTKMFRNKPAKCVVVDIYEITTVSQATGKSVTRNEYWAKQEGTLINSFHVSKTTILRGIIN